MLFGSPWPAISGSLTIIRNPTITCPRVCFPGPQGPCELACGSNYWVVCSLPVAGRSKSAVKNSGPCCGATGRPESHWKKEGGVWIIGLSSQEPLVASEGSAALRPSRTSMQEDGIQLSMWHDLTISAEKLHGEFAFTLRVPSGRTDF